MPNDAGLGLNRFQPYLDAVLGFRNHWYPAAFSRSIGEGEIYAQEMLGERILLKRIDGRIYAMEDRCAHRGVPFSARPESYTKNTISCWYHGFTYDMRTGGLVGVITDPECPLIGKIKLKTYPVEERKNLIFVYIGDGEPCPLQLDLQPGLLDEDMSLYPDGDHVTVHSNWRLGAENGVDASHIYIHRNAGLVDWAQKALPLASYLADREGMVAEAEGAPKGVSKGAGKKISIWETEIEGVKIRSKYLPGVNAKSAEVTTTSLWLPCGLKVDPFPVSGMIQFEWYVPRDERSHHYIVTWGRRVTSASEEQAFFDELSGGLKSLVVDHFNNDDVVAREAMERFYSDEEGWAHERLFRPDMILVEWRKLASRHNRGIQRRKSGAGAAAKD
jgi:carbazole 1,9a-dioxygenase terminal dioxygenase component